MILRLKRILRRSGIFMMRISRDEGAYRLVVITLQQKDAKGYGVGAR